MSSDYRAGARFFRPGAPSGPSSGPLPAPGVPVLIVNPAAGSVPSVSAAVRLASLVLGRFWPGIVAVPDPGSRFGVRNLTLAAIRAGVPSVAVWGGDGTVSAAASALAGLSSTVPLGIVRGGSGDGAARGFGISPHAPGALRDAFGVPPVPVDLGLFAGHPFLAVAGIGFDAAVAGEFAFRRRLGQAGYVRAAVRAWRGFRPPDLSIRSADGSDSLSGPVLFAAFCKGPGWGGGLLALPAASPGDGLLHLVATPPAGPFPVAATFAWLRLSGRPASSRPGAVVLTSPSFTVGPQPPGTFLPCHADGEFFRVSAPILVEVRRHALRVRIPPRRFPPS